MYRNFTGTGKAHNGIAAGAFVGRLGNNERPSSWSNCQQLADALLRDRLHLCR